ncbi:HNH endonuclease signature motif containing protein [Rhodococcus sp. Eu-32]|uniref:HNH endonuclease signature motif containing protein n=1 Tax=Rhodococcus sp. Eu-32 TaxID=1017319 RepID=UPI001402090E|nr:HNH endonuclease signature motif containing protein [Rhodococcus sp. Eu-32]
MFPGSAATAGSAGSSSSPGSVLPIDAAFLAGVVASIEEQVEVLGRAQTVGLSNADRRALLVRMETVSRALFAMSHTWIADLIGQHGLDEIDGSVPEALAVLMRFSRGRAGQRIRFAKEFGERTALSGDRLEPVSSATARAAEDGVLDEEHQDIVRLFFKRLGSKVAAETRESAERQLAQLATELGPDAFKVAARRLYDVLDPDGDLDEERVAERTYMRFGDQDEAGLSKMTGVVDAEFRAYCEAAFAKWAKPGMCNPADDKPVVDEPDDEDENGAGSGDNFADGPDDPTLFGSSDADGCAGGGSGSAGTPNADVDVDNPDSAAAADAEVDEPEAGIRDSSESESESESESDSEVEREAAERAGRDRRGQGRRQHDAMKTILRQMLASGKLGQHRGLPVTAIVSMSLKDLEAGTGHAVTATGSLVRMRDAIRMASHARHYLTMFDNEERPLYLGRSKRIASADQRIVLMASDRGCTFPGCTRPATWSQVHHIDEWAEGGNTDIDSLTFGCDQHHRRVGPTESDWATTKAGPGHPYPGRTLWHAPSTIDPDRQGRVNHFHHPNEYIYPNPDVPLNGKPDGPAREAGEPPGEPDTV